MPANVNRRIIMHTIKHSVYGEMFNQVRGVVVGYD